MPFYRHDGMTMHMRGRKLPPPCVAVVGVGERRHACADFSGFQCDWPTGGNRTCDRHLCEAHAIEVGRNRHYCPEHHADHVDGQNQRGLFSGLLDEVRA